MTGAVFPEFNPRETNLQDEVKIIADACGKKDFSEITAYFLNRPRHHPAMDRLNALGVVTPLTRTAICFPPWLWALKVFVFRMDAACSV